MLERRDIALTEKDRQEWFRLLDRQATRCGWRVFAYALLSNHFHLFLRTPQLNLSAGMQAFESGDVSFFNREHERDGPLFQSRFHAVLIANESHARLLSRSAQTALQVLQRWRNECLRAESHSGEIWNHQLLRHPVLLMSCACFEISVAERLSYVVKTLRDSDFNPQI